MDKLDRAAAFTQECIDRFGYVTHNDLRIRAARGAVVTARAYGPDRTYTGAVYDSAGALLTDTQRFNHGDINPADPATLPPAIRAAAEANRRTLGIYAGALFPILGHLLFETLARLWPLAHLDTDGGGGGPPAVEIVVHDWPGLDLAAFFDNPLYRSLFEAIGVTPDRIVLADRPLLYDTLLIADPASRYHMELNAEMDRMLGFMRAQIVGPGAPGATSGSDRLYVSRSRWGSNRRVVNEAEVDTAMAARGFRVVYPEELSPAALIGTFAEASMLVSFDGSHAHLAAFCQPDTATVLFDTRPVPTQIAIARLRGFRILHLPLFEMPDLYQAEAGILDVPGLCRMAEQAIRERLIPA